MLLRIYGVFCATCSVAVDLKKNFNVAYLNKEDLVFEVKVCGAVLVTSVVSCGNNLGGCLQLVLLWPGGRG